MKRILDKYILRKIKDEPEQKRPRKLNIPQPEPMDITKEIINKIEKMHIDKK